MTTLAIYTIGDHGNLEGARGRSSSPWEPHDYEELYHQRATEVAGRDGIVLSFRSVAEFESFCNDPANSHRFDEVKFIGHGGPGVYAFAVDRAPNARSPNTRSGAALNVGGEPNASAVAASLSRIMAPSAAGQSVSSGGTGFINVDFEACAMARQSLQQVANSLASMTHAPTTIRGYRHLVRTIWSRRHLRTAIMGQLIYRAPPVDAARYRETVNAH